MEKFKEIFTRYDINIDNRSKKVHLVSKDKFLQEVADCIIAGNEEEISSIVKKGLKTQNPMEVIFNGLLPGMEEVTRLWNEGIFFLPQVILSSDTMLAGIRLCEQKMHQPMKKKGKIVTHTAEGDIHDIGQVIVNALLSSAGFEVINLGADVSVDTVVNTCVSQRPIMVTGTALMTTTMTAFPKIAFKLKKMKINIPFICGGGAVNKAFVDSFDLGIWGKEANQAVPMAEDALKGLSWQEMRANWNR